MDLDQLEAFALAADRNTAIAQLIPGTESFYYFSCLLAQQRKELDRVDELLATWRKRHRNSRGIDTIEARQLVLRLDDKTAESCNELRRQLHLEFNHQREVELARGALPTHLDRQSVDGDVLTALARKNHPGTSNGFTDKGLSRLLDEPTLEPATRYSMLSRLKRPDHPALIEHLVRDFNDRKSRFGEMPIHRRLLAEQLAELELRVPNLSTDPTFVECKLVHLQPSPDVAWEKDPKKKRDYLTRLWKAVSPLGTAFNSLRAHVLYHLLEAERSLGNYPIELFFSYLRMPREVAYLAHQYRRTHKDEIAQLGQSFESATLFPPVGNDEVLVRDYLREILTDADDFGDLGEVLDQRTLRSWFAAIKILAGASDLERWHQLLDDDGVFAELRDRVDIQLTARNRETYAADEPVFIEARVKNVKALVVNVFEINTLNYATKNGCLPDTSIDLDGLIAARGQTHEYSEPPYRSVLRRFELPEINKPGTYVIELLGGGISSRALIRKGGLRATERVGPAGHVFSIYDETNQRIRDATMIVGPTEYNADDAGEITIPFSTRPGPRRAVISAKERVDVVGFQHQAEHYSLSAGIFVARESLIGGKHAPVIVRPVIRVAGMIGSIELLTEPTLVVETVDRRGVAARRDIRDLELADNAEYKTEFRVPENLQSITIRLEGKVRSLSEQKDIDLSDQVHLGINAIDAEAQTGALHLGRDGDNHVGYALGKNGEPRPDLAVALKIRHRDFADLVEATVQTDANGRFELGSLANIVSLSARAPSGVAAQWALDRPKAVYLPAVHAEVGSVISIPALEPTFSLLERRGTGFVRDVRSSARIDRGVVRIEGLDGGDYSLLFPLSGTRTEIRVCSGRREAKHILGLRRTLEASKQATLAIASLSSEHGKLRIEIDGASPSTRVHIEAPRFVDSRTLWDAIGSKAIGQHLRVHEREQPSSSYVSGRDLGDEYRYILDRRMAAKRPGSAVERPALLLNPWARGSTDTSTLAIGAGSAYAAAKSASMREMAAPASVAKKRKRQANLGDFANIDFLLNSARVWSNLRPDKNGVIELDLREARGASAVRILVVDDDSCLSGLVALAEPKTETRDLRLAQALPETAHFSEVRSVSQLASDEALEVRDISTANVDIVDSVKRVYKALTALSGDPTLSEFQFASIWPTFAAAKKRELYSKYSCHELNIFLAFKDQSFFKETIAPHLADKHHKTFLDHYLVESTLDQFLEPWRYHRLNTLERILLASRLGRGQDITSNRIRNQVELVGRDLAAEKRLFDAVVGGGALEDDNFGFADAKTRSGGARRMKDATLSSDTAPAAPMAAMSMVADLGRAEGAELDDEESEVRGGGFGRGRDMKKREQVERQYRSPDKTEEWAENNYWKRRPHEQSAELIGPNRFWLDFATHRAAGSHKPFLSARFAEASSSFTEMMAALAVLELPFEAGKHQTDYDENSMVLRLGSPGLVFHKQVAEAPESDEDVPILLSQHDFRADDRHYWHEGEQLDKYVTGEMLTHVIYTTQVVLTNPTSAAKKLQLLCQIPQGALPVAGTTETNGQPIELSAHGTAAIEYSFYFPAPGVFDHYGAQVTLDEQLITSMPSSEATVVSTPSSIDTESWTYVSQHGSDAEVLTHIETANLARIDLLKIAWRMREAAMFDKTIATLERQCVFHPVLWSYALHHCDLERAAEYLRHCDGLIGRLGPELGVGRIPVDSVERGLFELLEYAPLVNARAHKLGKQRQIANTDLEAQYRKALERLAHMPSLKDSEWFEVATYLFMQDRMDEAAAAIRRISADSKGVQIDYMRSFCALLEGDLELAQRIATAQSAHPVDRWRKRFESVLAAISQASGSAPVVTDADDRSQAHNALASAAPSFELTQNDTEIIVRYRNLSECTVNFYSMDIELLFSRQPFLREATDRFSQIQPNHSERVRLAEANSNGARNEYAVVIPAQLANKNVVIEVEAAGSRQSVVHYAHDLTILLVERYGQLRVGSREGQPIAGAYVKVYSRTINGQVEFYKDGYTDLAGGFDYASISTDGLDNVERFALLLLDPERGSVIREVAPPPR